MLLNEDITVLRTVQGEYINGVYQSSPRIQLTIKGIITTKVQQNYQRQSEYNISLQGTTLEGFISIVTLEPLKTAETSELSKPDIVVYDNKMYEIISSTGSQRLRALQHYRHVAQYLESLDVGDGEPITGNPFKAGRVDVNKDGVLVGNRPELNFITGDNTNLAINDNNITDSIDIRISALSSGFTEIVFNENVSKLKVITVDGLKADSNNLVQHNKVLGINKSAVNQNFSEKVYFSGELFDTDIIYPIGTNLFLNGENISNIPPQTGFNQYIGKVIKTNTILIEIEQSIIL